MGYPHLTADGIFEKPVSETVSAQQPVGQLVFIIDAVTPFGRETLLLDLLRRMHYERASERHTDKY